MISLTDLLRIHGTLDNHLSLLGGMLCSKYSVIGRLGRTNSEGKNEESSRISFRPHQLRRIHLIVATTRKMASNNSTCRSPLLTIDDRSITTDSSTTTPAWRHPIANTVKYFSELSGHFSVKFLLWLAVDNFFISGGIITLINALSLPLFKRLDVSASRQQLYTSMISAPWAMKAFIGVASELFPIRGYNKKYLALFAILIGLAGSSALLGTSVLLSIDEDRGQDLQKVADWLGVCFTAISYEAASLDILAEGKYAELMHLHPESGTSIITFKYGWHLLGGIVVQSFLGPLSDRGQYVILFWIILAFSLTPLLPTIQSWIPEKKRTKEDQGIMHLCCRKGLLFNSGLYQENKSIFILITLSGLIAPVLAAVTLFYSLRLGLCVAAVLIAAFCCATYFMFPRSYFFIFMYLILTKLSQISVGSALGYYYTANKTCMPGGPNFDYTFYITATGIVGTIMSILSVILYERFMSEWKLRTVLILTTIMYTLNCMVDYIIVKRWNIDIGIPDTIFFMFGSGIFTSVITTLMNIPFSTINARIAPPELEASVFAYSCGMTNFCGMVSGLFASWAIDFSGMITVGKSCNFDALPLLIIVVNVLPIALIGLPVIMLIPDVYQTEELIDWEKEGWIAERDYEPAAEDDAGQRLSASQFRRSMSSGLEGHQRRRSLSKELERQGSQAHHLRRSLSSGMNSSNCSKGSGIVL